jgi:10 TM Acyl Transferase domain found in Cas1p
MSSKLGTGYSGSTSSGHSGIRSKDEGTLIARSSPQHQQQQQSSGNSSLNDTNRLKIDPQGKQRSISSSNSSCSGKSSSIMINNHNHNNTLTHILRVVLHQWKGKIDFFAAQLQVVVILVIAYIGNNWKYSYPRNDNQNYTLFWFMNVALLVVGLCTLQHTPNARYIQILNRSQTEEWKGWMQWAFIMVRALLSLFVLCILFVYFVDVIVCVCHCSYL